MEGATDLLFWLMVGAVALYGITGMETTLRNISISMLAIMMFLGWMMLPEALGETRIAAFLLGAAGGYFMGMQVNQRGEPPDRQQKKRKRGEW